MTIHVVKAWSSDRVVPVLEIFFSRTQNETDPDALAVTFRRAIAAEGYENLVVARADGRRWMEAPWRDLPAGVGDAYFRHRWYEIDPILNRALTARLPFCWNDVLAFGELDECQIALMKELRALGVHSGITVPVHGPGHRCDVLSLSVRRHGSPDQSRRPLVYAMAQQAWRRYLELKEPDGYGRPGPISFSAREKECLRWVKLGKSYTDIGLIMGISRKTVEFHVSNAMKKLDSNDKTSAVVKAIQCGLLEL